MVGLKYSIHIRIHRQHYLNRSLLFLLLITMSRTHRYVFPEKIPTEILQGMVSRLKVKVLVNIVVLN